MNPELAAKVLPVVFVLVFAGIAIGALIAGQLQLALAAGVMLPIALIALAVSRARDRQDPPQ